mmetsp:Transcript_45791/g.139109  ORF Transcript_45791/g.139109 Transcript_45791/m.139109 type:complete len:210 (+) Transcript_45791:212-841(+)
MNFCSHVIITQEHFSGVLWAPLHPRLLFPQIIFPPHESAFFVHNGMASGQRVNIFIISTANYSNHRQTFTHASLKDPTISSSYALLGQLEPSQLVTSEHVNARIIQYKARLHFVKRPIHALLQHLHIFVVLHAVWQAYIIRGLGLVLGIIRCTVQAQRGQPTIPQIPEFRRPVTLVDVAVNHERRADPSHCPPVEYLIRDEVGRHGEVV